MRRSLRSRLFAYIALGAIVSTGLTIALAAILVSHRAQAQAQRTLDRQAEVLASLPLPGSPTVRVYKTKPGRIGTKIVDGERARQILASVPTSGEHGGTLSLPHSRLLYSEREGPSGRVVLVRPARLAGSDTQPFVLSLLVAGLAGLLLSATLAFVLARRLARPIDALARASMGVSASREPVQVPVGAREPRELADLAGSFNDMARDLASAREAQRSFLLSVSHELKTPLTAIAGYAEGLHDGAVEPLAASAVIGAEAARLSRLIGDLLDLARMDRDTFTVLHEPVALSELAAQLLERYRPQADDARVVLAVHEDEGATVIADPGRLLQAASNLVENALRVTPPGGRIEIDVHDATLSVCDNGPGLEPEDLPRAFDRFYLHGKLAAHERSGSGLGLAIVRQLTEAMGGTVNVTSEHGRGAKFTITLPRAPSASALTSRSVFEQQLMRREGGGRG